MGFRYTCDLCHKVIKDRQMLSVGGYYVSTAYVHPACAPELVPLLTRAKARGIEELLTGGKEEKDALKRLKRLQTKVGRKMARNRTTEAGLDRVLKNDSETTAATP